MRIGVQVFEWESNLFLSHYYFIIQFILLSIFYVELLKYKWIYVILGLSICLLGYQYITDEDLYFKYNALGMFFTQIIIVVYALLYMYQSLTGSKEFTIVNVGIFMYLLASALIFASGNLIFNIDVPESFSNLLLDINLILFLVYQILIFIEWWKNYSVLKTK